MNSLDPSLAKYLSSSKQDIYDEYHGTGSSKSKGKSKKKRKIEGTSSNGGMLIGGDDGGDDSWNPWAAAEKKARGRGIDDDDEDGERMPGE